MLPHTSALGLTNGRSKIPALATKRRFSMADILFTVLKNNPSQFILCRIFKLSNVIKLCCMLQILLLVNLDFQEVLEALEQKTFKLPEYLEHSLIRIQFNAFQSWKYIPFFCFVFVCSKYGKEKRKICYKG